MYKHTDTETVFGSFFLSTYSLKHVDVGVALVKHAAGPEGTGSCLGEIADLRVCGALTDVIRQWWSILWLGGSDNEVNAGVWNDYTGGVLSAAACGPMGAAYQAGSPAEELAPKTSQSTPGPLRDGRGLQRHGGETVLDRSQLLVFCSQVPELLPSPCCY